jgi:hypothetical protein
VNAQSARASRGETDPMLEHLGLFGNADAHGIRGVLFGYRNDATRRTARALAPRGCRLT